MQRQDSTHDQLLTVYRLANEAGCYDAADLIKSALIDPTNKRLRELDIEVKEPASIRSRAPFSYFANRYGWDEVCDVLGWDVWFASEGKGSSDEIVTLSHEQLDKLEGKK